MTYRSSLECCPASVTISEFKYYNIVTLEAIKFIVLSCQGITKFQVSELLPRNRTKAMAEKLFF